MKFEIYSRKRMLQRRQWYFRLVASNGRTVAQSEGYNNKAACVDTCVLIREKAPLAYLVWLDS